MQSRDLRLRSWWLAIKTTALIACGLGLVFTASACSSSSSTHMSAYKLADKDVLLTSADLRATIALSDRDRGSIVCAEPSPDLARAVQNSFGAGGSVSADIPTQVSGSAAVSIARARAEAAAQLGERLATIQLLRDGLYRVCEAYANGAIDELFYALLLGRYDDTMVTMLAGELAAGNFGRQLASIGGNSNSDASPEADLDRSLAAVEDAAKRVEDAGDQVVGAGEAVHEAEAELALAETRGEDTTDEAAAVQEKKHALQDRQDNLVLAAKIAAKAAATASAATGGITQTANQHVAQVVHHIQSTYINDKDSDALVIACLTALSKPDKYRVLTSLCTGGHGGTGLLEKAMAAAGPALNGSPQATEALLVANR